MATEAWRWRGISPENGAKTDIALRRGWAPCGERLFGETARAHGQPSSFISAARQDRDEAPWLFD